MSVVNLSYSTLTNGPVLEQQMGFRCLPTLTSVNSQRISLLCLFGSPNSPEKINVSSYTQMNRVGIKSFKSQSSGLQILTRSQDIINRTNSD